VSLKLKGAHANGARRRRIRRPAAVSSLDYEVIESVDSAAESWRRSLDAWALPDEIVASAEESPWIHPPELFEVPLRIQSSPSHERAREAMPGDGTVLDVGCGGGIAAFALTPPAAHVIGVDSQPEMLSMFRANAYKRAVTCETFEGSWPRVANEVPRVDVVTAPHVVYNVGDIVPFLEALTSHARERVVLEMPDRHPLAPMTNAWRHFWQLDRPEGPTPSHLLEVLAEMGISAHREQWRGELRVEQSLEQAARYMRIRLCLPATREGEVRDFLSSRAVPSQRELSAIWWDA
jgi:SAM-dependent methyltransferase